MSFKIIFTASLFVVSILFTFSFVGTAFAKDFELTYDAFLPQSSILVDDKLIFSTLEKVSAGDNTPGSISVVDTKTGSLLYKIESPRQNVHDGWFGNKFVSVGNDIAVSSNFPNSDFTFGISSIHVFDGDDGYFLYTIDNPVPDSAFFGYSLTSIGDYLVAYASDDDPNDDKHNNMIHVFDGRNGSLLYTIDNPNTYGDFGRGLDTLDDKLLVAVSNFSDDEIISDLIYSFDIENGELLYTIKYPKPQARHGFDDNGGYALIADDKIVIRSDDAMFVYDGNNGELLHTEDGFPTLNSELHMMLYSLDNDTTDYYFYILIIGIVLVGIISGLIIFRRKK